MKRNKAFTLIEIILVVVILSVIAGMIMPALHQTFETFCLRQATQTLADTMRYAQIRALTKSKILRLKMDAASGSYCLLEQIDPASGGEVKDDFKNILGRWGRKVILPEGIELASSVSSWEFYPDGRMTKGEVNICRNKTCLCLSTLAQKGAVMIIDENIQTQEEENETDTAL